MITAFLTVSSWIAMLSYFILALIVGIVAVGVVILLFSGELSKAVQGLGIIVSILISTMITVGTIVLVVGLL